MSYTPKSAIAEQVAQAVDGLATPDTVRQIVREEITVVREEIAASEARTAAQSAAILQAVQNLAGRVDELSRQFAALKTG